MCRQFEREDILSIYLHKGQSFSSLSEEAAQEILLQADPHLKSARGKSGMRQITSPEVEDLFSDLRTDDRGRYNFHDMQKRILKYRQEVISRNKVVFPEREGGGRAGRRTQKRRSAALALAQTMAAQTMTEAGSGPSGQRRRTKALSGDVAPRTIFEKDAGFNDTEIAMRTTKLLSTRAYQISDPSDGSKAAALTSNVVLVREPHAFRDTRRDREIKPFDRHCFMRGSGMGSFVKSAASRTTAKRVVTIANR